jgi:predicted hotdog family 3-hydroxylacyl-ACP dehydratase
VLNAPATLGRDEIARRIPHQGNMCLLDTVLAWDNDFIRCETRSHLAAQHPLRAHGRLGAACGIEYAAQAMAVHGARVAERLDSDTAGAAAPPRAGYLASVRTVILHVERLDTVEGPLTVNAQRITGDANTVLYSFDLQAGGQALLSGRAVVVLDAAALSPTRTPGATAPAATGIGRTPR